MERAACGWEVAARWRGLCVDGRWRRDGDGGGVWPGPCGWRRRVAWAVWVAAACGVWRVGGSCRALLLARAAHAHAHAHVSHTVHLSTQGCTGRDRGECCVL